MEDDATISDLVAYNLRRAGYEVLQEHNGRAGLQTALSHDVDLVLMDLMLPALDGMAASKEIVRRKPSLPIIMLTARSERETMLEGFESGADDYITKPFDLDVLLARIQARLRRAPAGIAVGGVGRKAAPSAPATWCSTATRTPSAPAMARSPSTQRSTTCWNCCSPDRDTSSPARRSWRRVWHHRYLPASRSLDVHVRRLRAKLEQVQAEVSSADGARRGLPAGPRDDRR